MKIIITLFLTFILSLAAAAQEAQKWTRIANSKGDFTVRIPPNFLVDNEGGTYRVYAFDNQATIKVEIVETSDAKSRLETMRRFSAGKDVSVSRFEKGNFSGDVFDYKKESGASVAIYMASLEAFITVSAYAKEEKKAAVIKFLYSIKLNNQALFKDAASGNPDAEEAIPLASLKTSPIVLSMLKIADANKSPVKYALEDAKKNEKEAEDTPKYSRGLIVLRKPRVLYTDKARENNVSGIVRMKILFRSDGQVGEITVLQKLPDGLTNEAIKAARKIKFVPAEIDGKPVDLVKAVEYTFTLY
jgi:hypothetical protein